MFEEFNSTFKEFILSFFEYKKDSILDPLTCIIKLCILDFKPSGTKISLNNSKIKFNEPTILQGAMRWTNGDNREDLHNLFNPLKKAVVWYKIDNLEIKNLFLYSIKGLEKLKLSYNKNSVISHSIQYYIEFLKKNIDNQSTNSQENTENTEIKGKENTISKQLKCLWNTREITIVNNLILELEDNRKTQCNNLLDEQISLIKTLDTILQRKEEKVTNILFENTTLLN